LPGSPVGLRIELRHRAFHHQLRPESEPASFERRKGASEDLFGVAQLGRAAIDLGTASTYFFPPCRRKLLTRGGVDTLEQLFCDIGPCGRRQLSRGKHKFFGGNSHTSNVANSLLLSPV
jgi:hypothetical protein